MPSAELERLAARGRFEREDPVRGGFRGPIRPGAARLAAARKAELPREGRLDLAWGAAPAVALAARRGPACRAEKRHRGFPAPAHKLGSPAATWRPLAKRHRQRGQAEHAGVGEIGRALLADLRETAGALLDQVRALPVPLGEG